MKYTIFFSWQSDLPANLTRNAIRKELKNVKKLITSDEIEIDESTRNVPGSPDIPATIMEKINNSDIFICDLTTINKDDKSIKRRKVPNPNVMLELGYASAILGWERIIILFNKSYGEFPKDLPFDIARRSVIVFELINKDDNIGKGNLKTDLKKSIETIVKKCPRRNISQKNTLENIERERNINSINQIFNRLKLSTLDMFLLKMPHIINGKMLDEWDGFSALVNSSLFFIADKKLNRIVKDLYLHLDYALSFIHCYKTGNNDNHIFTIKNGIGFDTQEQNDWDKLTQERDKIFVIKNKLLEYIRKKYPDTGI